MDWSFSQYYYHTLDPIQRYRRLMVAAGYPPPLQRPLLTWSTSQSVLTTPPRPPTPLVQLQTRQTRSTARTPQCPASARSFRITTCTHTEDRLEQRSSSSSTTSRPAGAEQPGQRRTEEQDQDTGAQPDSMTLQPIPCPRLSPLRVVILGPSMGLLRETAAGTRRASCTGRPHPQPARAWTLLKLLLRLGAIMARTAIENTQQATEAALPTTHSLITTTPTPRPTTPTPPRTANPSPQ